MLQPEATRRNILIKDLCPVCCACTALLSLQGLHTIAAQRVACSCMQVEKCPDQGCCNLHVAIWKEQTHPAMVISKGNVRTAGEVTGGMWSFLSFTRRTMAVMTSSMAACSFAWRRVRTACKERDSEMHRVAGSSPAYCSQYTLEEVSIFIQSCLRFTLCRG